MTNSSDEPRDEPSVGIDDDQLPEDLQPGEDNPLAEPLPDDVEVDLHDGKIADEMEDPESDEAAEDS